MAEYFYEIKYEDIPEFLEENIDKEKLLAEIKTSFPGVEAVAAQMGYDDLLKEDFGSFISELRNIYSVGTMASASPCGFVYYRENEDFFEANMDDILEFHKQFADSLGMNFDEYVANFNSGNKGDYILDLLEGRGEYLKNDLVWGYVEGLANYVMDNLNLIDILKEDSDIEEEDSEEEKVNATNTRTMR